MREAQWEFIMSTTDRNVLPVCRKCRLPLSFRRTETVARAGTCEAFDLASARNAARRPHSPGLPRLMIARPRRRLSEDVE